MTRSLAVVAAFLFASCGTAARGEPKCEYKICPVHPGKQPCSHACPEVGQWVPMTLTPPPKPEPDDTTPPKPKGPPPPSPEAIAYIGTLKKETEDLKRQSEGRQSAEKKMGEGASGLSRKIGRDGTAIEQAKSARDTHEGASRFPDEPYHAPGKRSSEVLAEPQSVSGTASQEARKARVEQQIADTEKQLAETNPADVMKRAELQQKISDLRSQRGMIIYQMKSLKPAPSPMKAAP